jgi:hypothetical protein
MNLKCIKYLTIILILILSCKLEPPNEEPPPGDMTPPHIMVVYPANDAIGASITNSVSVTFSEPMDTTSAQGAFSLSDGVTPLAGTFSWSDDTMTFDPSSDLSLSTKYYVKVKTSAKDTSGNPLASEFNSSFTTAAGPDTTPPSITEVSPVDLATDVLITANVSITFSEQMEATASQNAFTLSAGVTAINGTFTWSGNAMTFDPSSNLSYSTTYSVKVTSSAKDTAGNSMASEFNSSFTTAAVPDTTPPTVTTPIVLNSSSTYTRNVIVSISHSVSEAAQMIISENSAFSGSSWVVYEASLTYTLSSMDGTKTVYIKYRDTADNETATYSDCIILDHNVYVSSSGSDSNAGTPDFPLLTLGAGVTLALISAPAEVRVEGSTAGIVYDLGSAGLSVPAGVSLMGGYKSDFSLRDSGIYVSKITSANAYTILCDGSSVTNATALDGFSITNTASFQENVYTVYCRNSASPRISNNKVRNEATNIVSSISYSAASACIYSDKGSPLVEENEIAGGTGTANKYAAYNAGSAGIYCYYGTPKIQNNISIEGGSGTAKDIRCAGSTGIYCIESYATIVGNLLIAGGSGDASVGLGECAGSAGIYCYRGKPNIANNKMINGGSGSANDRVGSVGIYFYEDNDFEGPVIENNDAIVGGSGSSSQYSCAGSAGIAGVGNSVIRSNILIDGGSGSATGTNETVGSSGIYWRGWKPIIENNESILGGSGNSAGYNSAGSAGIYIKTAATIRNNKLINGGSGTVGDHDSAGSAGIFCSTSNNASIFNNREIVGGSGTATDYDSAGGAGIYCIGSGTVIIFNNAIVAKSGSSTSVNSGIDTVCIWFDENSSGKAANNVLVHQSSNEYSVGIFLKLISDVRIANNVIFSEGGMNQIGIYERSSNYDPTIVINNLIFDCPTGLYIDEETIAITTIDDLNALAECSDNITTSQTPYELFVGGSPFDYHLKSGSNAIDAGYNTSSTYWGGVTVDIDGETRPKGSAYDIGFDEY